MNPEQYAALQAAITAKAAQYASSLTQFFTVPGLTIRSWLKFLELLFPQVQQSRLESAALGRRFYDEQRKLFHPELPRHDRNLEAYDFKQFVKEMDPARKKMSLENSPPDAKTSVELLVARSVEIGGRRQIIKAVEDDQELEDQIANWPKQERVTGGGPVLGWARIATGRETCAWCLMLVSRGPVYSSASKAGSQLLDWDAADAYARDDQELQQLMDEWHPGCDCKVIPVYDYNNWAGRRESERALVLWNAAMKEARKILNENPGKTYFSKKENAWVPTTLNREAQNALRRRLTTGEIQMRELTAAAA